jgi:iron(II)-dependent oxidoreductase
VDLRAGVVEHLDAARARTVALLAPFDDDALRRQASPLMSPLVWDLAHIGHYEELWLLRELAGAPPTDPRFDDLYDAFKHPRRERGDLEILDPVSSRAFLSDVRARVLDHLADQPLDGDEPLLRDGFVYGMVVQHEHQHDETMLATINLLGCEYPNPERGVARDDGTGTVDAAPDEGFVAVAGGEVSIGSDDPWAYDNERPRHTATVAPFRIAARPVTNAEFAAFVDDGGYDDPRLWTDRGWQWRTEASLRHPHGWRSEGGGEWSLTHFGARRDLPLDAPVEHVCWYEADAFARFAGARLPSETEWETAASRGAIGDAGRVWEWTSSDFLPYPDFQSFPYREYSEVFFGDEYKVLRGGSWATHPVAGRTTFRNWDYPIRRQIFSGVRLATDD